MMLSSIEMLLLFKAQMLEELEDFVQETANDVTNNPEDYVGATAHQFHIWFAEKIHG